MSEGIGHGSLSGSEPIFLHDAASSASVLAFWRWVLSDIMSNTARGLLAEFFVACALGITEKI